MTREELDDILQEHECVVADGLMSALVGVCYGADLETKAVYDIAKCIELLMVDGMTYEEADEFFDFNIMGAYMGIKTPIFARFVESSI
jgi:hypothetical protein